MGKPFQYCNDKRGAALPNPNSVLDQQAGRNLPTCLGTHSFVCPSFCVSFSKEFCTAADAVNRVPGSVQHS